MLEVPFSYAINSVPKVLILLVIHYLTPTNSTSFFNYTVQLRYSQRIPTSIFEDWAGKFLRLTKSPQAPRCRRECRLDAYHLMHNAVKSQNIRSPWGIEPMNSGISASGHYPICTHHSQMYKIHVKERVKKWNNYSTVNNQRCIWFPLSHTPSYLF